MGHLKPALRARQRQPDTDEIEAKTRWGYSKKRDRVEASTTPPISASQAEQLRRIFKSMDRADRSSWRRRTPSLDRRPALPMGQAQVALCETLRLRWPLPTLAHAESHSVAARKDGIING